MAKEERYVVLDCDVGNDDAWALMMLLKAEEQFKKFTTIAVTTVFGNSDLTNVTKNTIRLLDHLDRKDIPIYKGCSSGILQTEYRHTERFHGEDGFGDAVHSHDVDLSRVQKIHAVNAMYELACKYPKKVSYILLGPLTNFAMCIKMYDDFLDKVKDVWIMGGNIRGKGNVTKSAEYNFFTDPEAANIVLDNPKTPVTILPWEPCIDGDFDITLKWRLEVLGSGQNKAIELMNHVERAIFIPKGFVNWVVCDAILLAALLFPERLIVKSRQYHVTVELNGRHTRGQMVLDHRKPKDSSIRVIEQVHKDNYKRIISWTAGLPDVKVDWECLV